MNANNKATMGDKILFLIFGGILILLSSVLTFLMAKRLVPQLLLQFAAVFLFDGGALCWFLVYNRYAHSASQWSVSMIGFAVGIIGAVIMAGGELIMGQTLVVLEDTTLLGWVLIGTMVIALTAHASLFYLFHFTDPERSQDVKIAKSVSNVKDRAIKDAIKETQRREPELAMALTESIIGDITQDLDIATNFYVRNQKRRGAKSNFNPMIGSGDLPYVPVITPMPTPHAATPGAGRPHQPPPPPLSGGPSNGNGKHPAAASAAQHHITSAAPIASMAPREGANSVPPSSASRGKP